MSPRDLIQMYIDKESVILLSNSKDMSKKLPKPGYEKYWKEARERIEGLERIQMLLKIQDEVDKPSDSKKIALEMGGYSKLVMSFRLEDCPELQQKIKELEDNYAALAQRFSIRQDADIEKVAARLYQLQNQKITVDQARSTGLVVDTIKAGTLQITPDIDQHTLISIVGNGIAALQLQLRERQPECTVEDAVLLQGLPAMLLTCSNIIARVIEVQ